MASWSNATPLAAFRNASTVVEIDRAPRPSFRVDLARDVARDLSFHMHTDPASVESEWRRFEQVADATPFQTFAWLSAWLRHIGARDAVVPAIVVGHFGDGTTAFIFPFGIDVRHGIRRLRWLGHDLCDYNAPLLSRDFSDRVTRERFLALWDELQTQMQSDAQLRFDWIEFEKMPETLGAQINPFTYLHVVPNANSAHLTRLGSDWETYYRGKRSSATRRHDRSKRKRMSKFGDVRFTTVAEPDDIKQTLDILWGQKKRIFARKGIGDLFAQPGYREFFLDFATNAASRHLAHISRVEVGSTCAAANFAITFGGCYYHVLSSYCDGRIAHYGPGVLHLRELMAYAIGRGLQWFDFTIGDEEYKFDWSETRLRLYDFSAAATLRGWPTSALFAVRRRVKRFVKQTPMIWRLVCRSRAALGPLLHAKPQPKTAEETDHAVTIATQPVPACIMGGIDLLRPLAMAGIPCAVAAESGVPSLYSRFTLASRIWDAAGVTEPQLDTLSDFGRSLGDRPVLFFERDEQILFVSRHRERLAQAFRFVAADAPLVEDLLDKGRFADLAQTHGLPVPPAVRFSPLAGEPGELGLDFPIVIKPLMRIASWHSVFGPCKALAAENPDALRQLWPQLRETGIDLLAQQLVSGAEAQMESYHCYVDADGAVAGEFTGRKIRTYPVVFGHTTALETTDAEDVRQLGRDIVKCIGLTGVAKLDFKRDGSGRLHLLEINPRFTLWHHVGAMAGVNIPALVYADLTGTPRPPAGPAKPGIRWCRAWKDLPAAQQSGVPLAHWFAWFAGCEAKSSLAWNDPMPALRAALHLATARMRSQGGAVS